jgi:hypothetical protein
MESLREENILSAEAVVGRCEFEFRERKSMTQMEETVHIRVREVSKEFGLNGARIITSFRFKSFLVFPFALGRLLDVQE